MSTKNWRAILALSAGIAIIGVASAAAPADTIKTRQQGFKDMGAAAKLIRDELKATPDLAKIKTAAAKIQQSTNDMANWFPPGSGTEAGMKTAAKPEIWSDPDGFTAARKVLLEAAAKLVDAANSGDAEAIGAAVKDVGKGCGGCHQKYRVKED